MEVFTRAFNLHLARVWDRYGNQMAGLRELMIAPGLRTYGVSSTYVLALHQHVGAGPCINRAVTSIRPRPLATSRCHSTVKAEKRLL